MIEPDPRARAAQAARRVIRSLVTSELSDRQAESVADQLDRLANTLAPCDRPSRFADEASCSPGNAEPGSVAREEEALFRTHPLVGRWHPLAPPLHMTAMGERPVAEVTYGPSYEGFRGIVHGGFVALAFDYITVLAAFGAGRPGMTGRLEVRYRKPVPLGVAVRYEAWIERRSGRTSVARAALNGPDGRYAEAETLIIGER